MKRDCPDCGNGFVLNPLKSDNPLNFRGWCSNCHKNFLLPNDELQRIPFGGDEI